MGQYLLKRTLVKHGDSVNALAFSYDRSLFVSGADDGLILVFEGNGNGRELRWFQAKAPVAALLWRSRFGFTLLAGDTCGDVHTICLCDLAHGIGVSYNTFGSSSLNMRPYAQEKHEYYHTINNVPGPVHCIVQSDSLLAISSGSIVQLIKQVTFGLSHHFSLLCLADLEAIDTSYLGGHLPASRPA